MKTIIPFTVSLTILALLLLLLRAGHTPDNSSNSPASTSSLISEAAESDWPSSNPVDYPIADFRKKGLPRSVKVSDWAIRKAADHEIMRLEGPLKSLFQRWGLGDEALSKALSLIYDRRLETSLLLNQRANDIAAASTHDAEMLHQQRKSAIAIRYEAEMLSIIGSSQRLFEMTTLVTRVNYDNYRSGVPARKAEVEKIQELIATDVAKLKGSQGSNYQQVMRERYGDAATESMLQLLEKDRD